MPCGRVLTQLQPARVHACARTHAHTLYTSCPGNTDTFNDGHSFLSSIDWHSHNHHNSRHQTQCTHGHSHTDTYPLWKPQTHSNSPHKPILLHTICTQSHPVIQSRAVRCIYHLPDSYNAPKLSSYTENHTHWFSRRRRGWERRSVSGKGLKLSCSGQRRWVLRWGCREERAWAPLRDRPLAGGLAPLEGLAPCSLPATEEQVGSRRRTVLLGHGTFIIKTGEARANREELGEATLPQDWRAGRNASSSWRLHLGGERGKACPLKLDYF